MVKIPFEEISKHNTINDCWIVINNHVFDVTNYLKRHPGGSKIILKFAGKDCSDIFFKIHGPKNIRDIKDVVYIGDVSF